MTDDITRLVRFTSKGLDEVLQAKNQGLKGEITHIAAGTGRYNPTGNETALRNERQRVAIVDYEDLGQRQLRMAALFDGDGELQLEGTLPELGLAARLNSAGVARHYTINDYDLRAQP